MFDSRVGGGGCGGDIAPADIVAECGREGWEINLVK